MSALSHVGFNLKSLPTDMIEQLKLIVSPITVLKLVIDGDGGGRGGGD